MALPNTGFAFGTIPAPVTALFDFIVTVDLSLMPASWWAAVDTSDATKGRASKHSEEYELAVKWVAFDDTAETGFAYIRWTGALPSNVNSLIRIYPPKAANTSYAASDPYGANSIGNSYLKAFYGFDQDPSGSAPQLTDYSGNGNHGTSSGSMTSGDLVAGKTGSCLDFDGTDDEITTGSLQASLFGLAEFSCSCLIRATAYGTLGKNYINVIFGDDASGNGGTFQLRLGTDGTDVNKNKLHAQGITSGVGVSSVRNSISGTTAIALNAWYHVGFRRQQNGTFRLYVNGTTEANLTATNLPSGPSGTGVLKIGEDDNRGRNWQGQLDDLKFYSAILPDAWYATESAMLLDQATFWNSSWTWVAATGGASTRLTLTYRNQDDINPSVAHTDREVLLSLTSLDLDFSQYQYDGRNVKILDTDQTTALTPSIWNWRTGKGLTFVDKYPIPSTPGGGPPPDPYIFGTGVDVGLVDHATNQRLIFGCGSAISGGGAVTAYGAVGCFNLSTKAEIWRFTSASGDYCMGVLICDPAATGNPHVLAVFRRVNYSAHLINSAGTQVWSHVWASTGFYMRAIAVGNLTGAAGEEIFIGGETNRASLLQADGTSIWHLTNFASAVASGQAVQSAKIFDPTGGGTSYIYCSMGDLVVKANSSGTVVASSNAGASQALEVKSYGIDYGYITTTSGTKQVVTASALGDTVVISYSAVCVYNADTLALIWQKYLPYNIFTVVCEDIDGDGFDEIIVGFGSHVTADPPLLGWGGLLVLNRFGDVVAGYSIPSSPKFAVCKDIDGDGKKELICSCDDGNAYVLRFEATGALLAVTLPSITADTDKLIYVEPGGTEIPPKFDYSGNGFRSIPAGWTARNGTWVMSGHSIAAPDDGSISTLRIIETDISTPEFFSVEIDFTKAKRNGGGLEYYTRIFFRASNFDVTNGIPNGYMLDIPTIGTLPIRLYRMATGNATPAFTMLTGAANFTLLPTQQMTVRIVSGGIYHSISYRINDGDWVQFGDVENGAHPSGGVIALGQARGQTRFDRVQVYTYSEESVTGLGKNSPTPMLTDISSGVSPNRRRRIICGANC